MAATILPLEATIQYFKINLPHLLEQKDKEDPNYAIGKLIFGFIEETNVKHIEYTGD